MFTCDLLCFAETHIKLNPRYHISKYLKGWVNVHKSTAHGLAVCYNAENVEVVAEYKPLSNIDMLPLLMKVINEMVLLILIY